MRSSYPKVFIDFNFEYDKTLPDIKLRACNDGLEAWKLIGDIPIPKNFGVGMSKIAAFIGVPALESELKTYRHKYLKGLT